MKTKLGFMYGVLGVTLEAMPCLAEAAGHSCFGNTSIISLQELSLLEDPHAF